MTTKSLFLLFILLGVLLTIRVVLFFTASTSYREGQIISFKTRVSNAPKIGINYQQISFTTPSHERGFVRLPQEPSISYGDIVELSGAVSYIETKNGSRILSIVYPKFRIVDKDNSVFTGLRNRIVNFFSQSSDRNNSALMLGIVFGIKQEFSGNFNSNIQKTGLLHVIAASGMNITMIGGFFSAIFAVFLNRRLAVILTIITIILYAVLAGAEPSIIRASIMGILVFTAQILGRQSTSFFVLGLAGFIMLILDPALVTDTGFQLSFMATFGLIFFRPIFYKIPQVKTILGRSVVGEDLLTTITAQIFTLPILVLSFGSYSPISILSNMLVLWTVPILMAIGGIGFIVSLLVEPFGKAVLALSLPLLEYFRTIVNFFGQRAGVFTLNNIPFSIVLGYYLLLISAGFRFGKSDKGNDTL